MSWKRPSYSPLASVSISSSLKPGARGIRVAVNEADDVGAVRARLLAAHLELDALPGGDREPVGVAVNRSASQLRHLRLPEVADAAEEDAVHRRLLGGIGLAVVEDPRRLAADARERADAVLPPRLDGDDDVLARLRLAPEVREHPLEGVGVLPERLRRVLRDQLVGDQRLDALALLCVPVRVDLQLPVDDCHIILLVARVGRHPKSTRLRVARPRQDPFPGMCTSYTPSRGELWSDRPLRPATERRIRPTGRYAACCTPV